MSDEQPSEFTDALIIKAATSALEKDKNKHVSKRWHLPASIAAGAVFTFSIVTQLDPWSDATIKDEAESKVKLKVVQLQKRRSKKSVQRKTLQENLVAMPQTDKAVTLRPKATALMSPGLSQEPSKTKSSFSTAQTTFIDEQLTVIEYYLERNKRVSAEKSLQLFIKKNDIDSLTTSQQQRIEKIQKTLK